MPTLDNGNHRMTVRHSPHKAGHLEVTIDPAAILELDAFARTQGQRIVRTTQGTRVNQAIQLTLDRNDAMALSDLLEQVAYEIDP